MPVAAPPGPGIPAFVCASAMLSEAALSFPGAGTLTRRLAPR